MDVEIDDLVIVEEEVVVIVGDAGPVPGRTAAEPTGSVSPLPDRHAPYDIVTLRCYSFIPGGRL